MTHVKTTEPTTGQGGHDLLSPSGHGLTDAGRFTRNVLAYGQTDWSQIPQPDAPAPAVPQPSAAGDYVALGTRLLNASRFAEAIPAFRQAIARLPNNAALHHDLGLAYAGCGRFTEALTSLETAVKLKDDFASAHYQLGRVFEMVGADASAMKAYCRVAALTPSHAVAHERIGALNKRIERIDEAIESFERAAATRPETTTTRVARALALALRGRADEAEKWFRRAIARDPSHRYLLTEFGIFLSQQGRLAEAAEWYLRACRHGPANGFAFLNLATIKNFTAADRSLLDRIVAQIETDDIDPLHREAMHYGLGKAFNDLADYAAAMRHYDAANGLARRRSPFDREAMARVVDCLIESFVPGAPDWEVPPASEDSTPLLIVGMPRSGTTLVEQIISSHPQVGAGGELVFWDKPRLALEESGTPVPPAAQVHALATEYCPLLHRIAPGKERVTDKMPFNLFWLGPIHRALPNARFIHCRRHPVDTCLSIYMTRFAAGSFYTHDRGDLVFVYRQYQRLMAHWRAVVPPNRLLEVDYEALIADPAATARRIVAFCGLEWDEACLAPERNRRTVKTASLWQVRQPVYSSAVGRWQRYEPFLGELRELLDEGAA